MNVNEIATKEDILVLQQKINSLIATVESLKSSSTTKKDETYLTSKEVMELFKISKSHLSDLRIEGRIPYMKPFGVLLYPKSEIDKILRGSCKPPSNQLKAD